MPVVIDMAGRKFGALTVIERAETRKNRVIYWLCRCDCGILKLVGGKYLRRGSTVSCGCKKRRAGKANDLWRGCGDISGSRWAWTVNEAKVRGLDFTISLAQAWELFVKQDGRCAVSGQILRFPQAGVDGSNASLDRIDSNLGYVDGNIQWVDKTLNKMKGNLSQLEFIRICRMVAAHSPVQQPDSCQIADANTGSSPEGGGDPFLLTYRQVNDKLPP